MDFGIVLAYSMKHLLITKTGNHEKANIITRKRFRFGVYFDGTWTWTREHQ